MGRVWGKKKVITHAYHNNLPGHISTCRAFAVAQVAAAHICAAALWPKARPRMCALTRTELSWVG